MILKVLSTRTMLAQSKRFIFDAEVRRAIEAIDLTAPLLPQLEKVHRRLAEQEQRRLALEHRLSELTQQATTHDGVHDRSARGVFFGLEAIAQASSDPAQAEACRDVQRVLFPDGLGIVQCSYLEEAGAAESMERRVMPEHRALLKSIKIGSDRLIDWYTTWVEAGEALRSCVQERDLLATRTRAGGVSADDIDGRLARNQWIATVHLLVNALDLAEVDAETRTLILAPLERSIAAAVSGEAPAEAGEAGEAPAEPADAADAGVLPAAVEATAAPQGDVAARA